MNVIHIATTESGGAGSAVLRLHNSLIKLNYQSHILVLNNATKNINITDVSSNTVYILALKIFRKIKHELNKKLNFKIIKKYNYFNYSEKNNYFPNHYLTKNLPFKPDVIIVHFVTHFVNVKNIYELSKILNCKVIFNMVDMAILTGGCHFAWDCRGYLSLCENCPAISSKIELNNSHDSILYKQKYLNLIIPELVATSESTYTQALKSSLFKAFKIHKSLLPIDGNLFKPGDKITARNHFNLPINKIIIFAGSQNLDEERKGFLYFIEALNILYSKLSIQQIESLVVVTAGEKPIDKFIKFKNIHLGTLRGNSNLIFAYQCADIFVCPSIEDSSPMMINEAICCGLPVVCFDMGVARDLISYPDTGYRAINKDEIDFANGLHLLLFDNDSNSKRLKMQLKCRRIGLEKTTFEVVGKEWDTIIKNLIT